ncbi:MAG: 7-cyano-7-deazaguanine synthase [Candidatus Pacearchaeota archaeon]|jgi:tRNA(Ile)-lysidine synthase TilS/MesJ
MKEKCIVLFSGGLDSRLVVCLMQKRGYEVIALHFNLPFGCGCCDFGCNFNFTRVSEVKFKIFDCTKGELFKEYLNVLKKGKHGRGKGFNPCRDCKIFMFKKAKEYADKKKIKVIATGEVPGQRPMSQTLSAIKLIDSKIGFKLLRPLMELGIKGRQRKKQIELAKKYKIKYPNPAGGCLLCEKYLEKRFEFLIKNNLINEENYKLVNVSRHFKFKKAWIILGRNEKENKILENSKVGEKIIPDYIGPSALIVNPHLQINKKLEEKISRLIKAYSKKGTLKDREKFEKYKL